MQTLGVAASRGITAWTACVRSMTARETTDTPAAVGGTISKIASPMRETGNGRRCLRRSGTSRPCLVVVQPGRLPSTPMYTAQVRHWSELIAREAAEAVRERLGEEPDAELFRSALRQATAEIELLTGRAWRRAERRTTQIDSGGLPLAEVPDMQRATLATDAPLHAIPDPVHPHMSSVLQLAALPEPSALAIPTTDALWIGGQLIHHAARAGMLSEKRIARWLGEIPPPERVELLRRVVDPNYIQHVPILAAGFGGWWVQVSRRLMWITQQTPTDEGRLVQPVLPDSDPLLPLVALEPVVVLARLTTDPIEWAMTVRIWTDEVPTSQPRPWSPIARAIRGYGVPIVRIDAASSREETACHLVLLGHWHGYVDKDEPGLVETIIHAFPKQVSRVLRGTGAPDVNAAAATLLEGLLYPGFDPARGAEANRRYVRRKANIAVVQHRKAERSTNPWQLLGISERHYYKLLPRFASKVAGRYAVDDTTLPRMRAFLEECDRRRTVHEASFEVLIGRGFKRGAARKWLQRHRPEEAIWAYPRGDTAAVVAAPSDGRGSAANKTRTEPRQRPSSARRAAREGLPSGA